MTTTSVTSIPASSNTAEAIVGECNATGFRRGFTLKDAIPLDSPVKARGCLVSSSSAGVCRKDSFTQDASTDESSSPGISQSTESQSNPQDPQATDEPARDQLARHRLNNALSARRSRARKMETLETLRREKAELEHEVKEKDVALTRASEGAERYKGLLGELMEKLTAKSPQNLETLEILRSENAKLQHDVTEKNVALTRAFEETERYKGLLRELMEQLTIKSSLSMDLEETNDRLVKELLAITTERDSLLARFAR